MYTCSLMRDINAPEESDPCHTCDISDTSCSVSTVNWFKGFYKKLIIMSRTHRFIVSVI